MTRLATIAGALLLALPACAHSPPKGMGHLRVMCCGDLGARCEPDREASVIIDGVDAGACGDWWEKGRDIHAGLHHLHVEPSQQHTFSDTDDVLVPEGKQVTVRAYLPGMPD